MKNSVALYNKLEQDLIDAVIPHPWGGGPPAPLKKAQLKKLIEEVQSLRANAVSQLDAAALNDREFASLIAKAKKQVK